MSKNGKKIAIIGGGAAGVMTAVLLSRAGFSVTLFEKNDKIGKKLLITGNGRCNLSNCKAASEYYFFLKASESACVSWKRENFIPIPWKRKQW